jgi:hypothetical protein
LKRSDNNLWPTNQECSIILQFSNRCQTSGVFLALLCNYKRRQILQYSSNGKSPLLCSQVPSEWIYYYKWRKLWAVFSVQGDCKTRTLRLPTKRNNVLSQHLLHFKTHKLWPFSNKFQNRPQHFASSSAIWAIRTKGFPLSSHKKLQHVSQIGYSILWRVLGFNLNISTQYFFKIVGLSS